MPLDNPEWDAAGSPVSPVASDTRGEATVGQRQNNPLNLEYAGQRRSWAAQGGRFAVFPDMPTGVAATAEQLAINQNKHGINTVRGQAMRWVNDPAADMKTYIDDTARAVGVRPDDHVDFSNPHVQAKYILAAWPHESAGGGGRLDPADVHRGVQLAASRRAQPQQQQDWDSVGKPVARGAPAASGGGWDDVGKLAPTDGGSVGGKGALSLPLAKIDTPAPAAPAEVPGYLSLAGQSLLRGAIEGGTSVAQAPTAFRDRPAEQDNSYVGQELRKPFSEGWSDPRWWVTHILHGGAASAPSLVMGGAGALGAAAMFPEVAPVAGLAGGAGGFALGSMIQEIAPAYQKARAEGLDHDAAVNRALASTGIAGLFGGAMGAVPGASVFGKTAEGVLKRPISEALLQIFGTFPALGAGQQVATGAVEGKLPTADELATGYATNVGIGGGFAAGHAGVRALRGAGAPGEPVASTGTRTAAADMQAELERMAKGQPPSGSALPTLEAMAAKARPPAEPPAADVQPGEGGVPTVKVTPTVEEAAPPEPPPSRSPDVSRETPIPDKPPISRNQPEPPQTEPIQPASATAAAAPEAAAPTVPPPVERPADYGASNTMFTADDAAAQQQNLQPVARDLQRPPQAPIVEGGTEPGVNDGLQVPVSPRDERPGPEDVQRPGEVGGDERAPPAQEPRGPSDAGGTAEGRSQGTERPTQESAGPAPGGGAGAGDTDRVRTGTPEPGEGGAAGRPPEQAKPDQSVTGVNHVIEPGWTAENRSPRVKAADNLAAIELAKRITEEGRPATKVEQAILAKYVGWGGLSGAFENPRTRTYGKGFEDIGPRLRGLLNDAEYDAASRSTQYAHYTAENVIRSMWNAVRDMGFKGGSVFEPGMGIGHFLGMMPGDLAAKSRYEGIEFDPATAQIAKLLYPESGVRQADYTRTPMPVDQFDLAIGNPPFSDTVIYSDPKYSAQRFMLHDYFFAKSLDSVRPGGLLGFVTSAGTMNKMDAAARNYFAERAEFVGGVRLPSDAFKRNAGTEVTTDILFFKKRLEPQPGAHDPWTETVARDMPNSQGEIVRGAVNRYFSEHPEQILGQEGFTDKLYKDRYAVQPDGRDLTQALAEGLDRLPKNVMEDPPTPQQKAALDFSSGQKKDGSYYITPDGRLMQYRSGAGSEVARRGAGVEGGLTSGDIERVRHLVPLRDALRDVFAADLARDDEKGAAVRKALNKHYDSFVKKFGPINKAEFQYRRPTVIQQESARLAAREEARSNGEHFEDGDFTPAPYLARNAKIAEIAKARQAARDRAAAQGRPFDEGTFDPEDMPNIVIERRPNIRPFGEDPENYRLRSIEDYNDETGEGSKKAIFSRSILTHEEEPQLRSANDGVLWSLNKHGRLDLDAIAQQMGVDRQALIAELGTSIFRVPGKGETYQTRDEYLSGDVVSKLEEARAAAESDPEIRRNILELEGAIPPPLAPSEITMAVGMPWIPGDVVRQFAHDELKIGDLAINHNKVLGQWSVRPTGRGDLSGIELWSTPQVPAHELLRLTMNRVPPKIYVRDRDGSHFDAVGTQAAQDKVDAMKQAFADWIKADPNRQNNLARLYNDNLNRVVLRKFDGSYLTTPGVSSEWKWRPHQTRVVARIVQAGNTYMAHAVGAGKTSAMIGSAMEMRRLGLVRKPMFVVPNHMLGQFTKEFYEQYPTARIAVADDQNFHTDRRRQFISNVAQDDLDAVIITHSSFGKVPISQEFQDHLVREQIAQTREALKSLDKQGDRFTIKRLENQLQALEQKLSKKKEGQDITNTFEELGVDFLYVDEAHLFRKLQFATKQSGMKGIDPDGSDMAWDLYTKARYLDDQRPGRSMVMASGTPVTNTMGELYSVSRYMQPHELEARGISHFDSWAQMFGDTKTALEQDPAGGYKPQTRFSRFVNMPELFKMVGANMDIVTPTELDQYVVRPKIKDGQRQMHMAPKTEFLEHYQETLRQRMKAIARRKGPPNKGDDILLSVINDGRHSAIDPRFVARLPSDPDSKLNLLIDNVARIYHDTSNHQFYDPGSNYQKRSMRGPATQMVFANLGVNGRGPMAFSSYAWIKSALAKQGVDPRHVAFIGDFKTPVAKQALFNDMNSGKVRVLVGSTAKMGTGVNAQRRLVALHNLDPLWYPADDEQRVGRILRQGNHNPEIQVHDYSTKGTYDSQMWQLMGRKARFIEQFFRGDPNLRNMEDLGEASMYEQAAAMSTSDERVIRLTEMQQELDKLQRRADAHDREQYTAIGRRDWAHGVIRNSDGAIALLQRDIAQRQDTRGKSFAMTVMGEPHTDRKTASEAIDRAITEAYPNLGSKDQVPIGEISGFPLLLDKVKVYGGGERPNLELQLNGKSRTREIKADNGGAGAVASLEHRLRSFEDDVAYWEQRKRDAAKEIEAVTPLIGREFPHYPEIDRLREAVRQLEEELKAPPAAAPPPARGFGVQQFRGEPALQAEYPGQEFFARRPSGEPESAAPAIDPEARARLQDAGERLMREAGLPRSVALKLVDQITDAAGNPVSADGRYTRSLIELALNTPPDQIASKLYHEITHGLLDPALGILKPGERAVLLHAADRWLDRGSNRADLTGRGYAPIEMRAEAVARMGEEALARGLKPPEPYSKIARFVERLGNMLRGMGFHTADDVFNSVLSGARRTGEAPAPTGRVNQMARGPGTPAAPFDLLRDRTGIARAVMEVKVALAPTAIRGAAEQEALQRRHGAELARSTAQAGHELTKVRDAMDRLPTDQQDQFTQDYETHQQHSMAPELQPVAQALADTIGKRTTRLQAMGYLEDAIEDYLGRAYANYAEWRAGLPTGVSPAQAIERAMAAGQAKSPLLGSGAFLKQRRFPTLREAMDAGLEPITHNPIDMALFKIREMDKYIHGKDLADQMKDRTARFVRAGQDETDARAAGWVQLDDRIFKPRIMGENNPAGFGRLEPGNWYAPEPAARLFNRYMSRGLAGQSVIYDTFRVAGNALNQVQLGLSGFHATFVSLDTAISRVALGLQQLREGQIGRGLTGVMLGWTPATVVNTVRRGAQVRNALLDPATASALNIRRVEDVMRGGGRISMDAFYRTNASGSFFKKLSDLRHPENAFRQAGQMISDADGLVGKAVLAPLKIAGRLIETVSEPLMGALVPRAKLGVFTDMADNWHRMHPNGTEAERNAAMIKAWNSVDNRLGQMVYDNVAFNKIAKDIAFVTTRSVGWNLGTIRELGGAVPDTARFLNDAAHGRSPELTARMAYTMAMPVVVGIYGAILTYLATGAAPTQMLDYFFPPNGGQDPNGEIQRRMIPSYIKDVIEYFHDPAQTVMNKTHPLISTAGQIYKNRDYFGGIIYHPQVDNAPAAYADYLLNQVIPFSWRGAMRLHDQQAPMIDQVGSFWGLQPAPASIVNPERGEAYQVRQDIRALRARAKEDAKGRIHFFSSPP